MISLQEFPPINATLNGLSGLLLVIGLIAIKNDRKKIHICAMVSALVCSTLFLACYLTYHAQAGRITFTHTGWPRTLYFSILIPHTILAVVMLPMIVTTVILALRARYDWHRRVARWTWPIWLFVSITGVLVYFMLYVWFPHGS